MKIARIFAHRVELPLVEGTYKWSGGKSVSVFDSTIVGVETACGLIGYGEVCSLGRFYLPAYAEGVRAGLRELGRIFSAGIRVRLPSSITGWIAALKGHPYVKSGIDIACWDLLGQGDQAACLHIARRPLRREYSAIARSRKSLPMRWPVMCKVIVSKGTRAFNSKLAAIPTRTLSAFALSAPCSCQSESFGRGC